MNESKIRLPAWLSTGMVFQNSITQLLFGYIRSGAVIRLEVTKSPTNGRKVSKLDIEYGTIFKKEVYADDSGKFVFELPAQKPSTDEYSFLFVSADDSVEITQLRCGDVWFLLGSKPFSVPISKTGAPKTPLKEKALEQVRLFSLDKAVKKASLPVSEKEVDIFTESAEEDRNEAFFNNVTGSWFTAKNSKSLADFSSVGFSMAYHLCDQLSYPVGIVDLSMAEEDIFSWIPKSSIKNEQLTAFIEQRFEDEKSEAVCWDRLTSFADMNIRGLVFAPDKKDCSWTEIYTKLLSRLIENTAYLLGPKRIRSRKQIPSLILLQLPMECGEPPNEYKYVHFNEVLSASRKLLQIPVGVVSQHDMLLPDKSYPFYIGRRLSYIALGQHFTPKMPESSPECADVEVVGNKILLTFDHSGDGLKLADGESILRGFSICGEDRVYRPAQSKILHGVRVMVWHDDIPHPVGVTYGYYTWPQLASFRSKSDLPVLPFRFDRSEASYSQDMSFTHFDSLTYVGIEKIGDDVTSLPMYEICKGKASLVLEHLNKTEGAFSLKIQYKTEDGIFSFAPILRYASMYMPLDLRAFKEMKIDVFNPDEREKEMSISGFSGSAVIARGLRWQTISFQREELSLLPDLQLSISDYNLQGEVYIDNMRFC